MSSHGSGPFQGSGFLVLDKPAGVSSAKALNVVKRLVPRGTKVGHAGTLDPFATGVLVVLVGAATKLAERVMGLDKGYETTLTFGVTTDTFDPEGEPVATMDVGGPEKWPTREQIEAVLPRFLGTVEQVPPAHSAIKVGGRRSYDLARAGRAVPLAARPVRVERLVVRDWTPGTVSLSMTVGRGFYVRSLARDLSEALGVPGHLTALRRSFVGPFAERGSVRPSEATIDDLLPADWLDAQLGDVGR